MKLHYVAFLTIGAFLAGRFIFQPSPKIVEKVKTVEVEKKTKKEEQKKKITSVKIKKPDGTVETHTQVDIDSRSQTNTKKDSVVESSKSSQAGITVGVLALKNLNDFSKPFDYGLSVTVPIVGKLRGQILGTTNKQVGVGIGIEF